MPSENKELFAHFASVLHVADIAKSLEFYRVKLGFKVTFEWNNPIDYVILKRGEVSVHLSKRIEENDVESKQTSLYIFVYDADAVHREFVNAGVKNITPVEDRDYGMRDFDVREPDGYLLAFGTGMNH